MGFDRIKIRQIVNLMLLATALILGVMYSSTLMQWGIMLYGIIKPFIYGCMIAFVLNIPMSLIENKLFGRCKNKVILKCKRVLSLIITLLLLLIFAAIIGFTIIPELGSSMIDLGNKVPGFVQERIDDLNNMTKDYPQINTYVSKLESMDFNWNEIVGKASQVFSSGVTELISSTMAVAGNLIGKVFRLVIGFIFAIYLLGQKERFQRQCVSLVDAYCTKELKSVIMRISSLLYINFWNYITVQCTEAVLLGTMFIVSMTLLNIPYAFVVGVIIAIFALIPIVGTFIGCIISCLLICVVDPFKVIEFVILFLILQQTEANVIYPRVVGTKIGLPPMWVLFAVTVGGGLFGILGMFLFIPLTSTVYSLLKEDVEKKEKTTAKKIIGKKKDKEKGNLQANIKEMILVSENQSGE